MGRKMKKVTSGKGKKKRKKKTVTTGAEEIESESEDSFSSGSETVNSAYIGYTHHIMESIQRYTDEAIAKLHQNWIHQNNRKKNKQKSLVKNHQVNKKDEVEQLETSVGGISLAAENITSNSAIDLGVTLNKAKMHILKLTKTIAHLKIIFSLWSLQRQVITVLSGVDFVSIQGTKSAIEFDCETGKHKENITFELKADLELYAKYVADGGFCKQKGSRNYIKQVGGHDNCSSMDQNTSDLEMSVGDWDTYENDDNGRYHEDYAYGYPNDCYEY